MKRRISEIKHRINYTGTLRDMKVGESCTFRMIGAAYHCMHSAKTRLRKKGYDFQFVPDLDNNIMHITRLS